MNVRVGSQVCLRQPEQGDRRAEPVLLEMNKCTRELDEPLEECMVRPSLPLLQPQILQYVVSLVVKPLVEAVEPPYVPRIPTLVPQPGNPGCHAR